MPNNNSYKTKEISLATYLIILLLFLIGFILTGAICLDTGNELTGLVLMLIGIVCLAIFNTSTHVGPDYKGEGSEDFPEDFYKTQRSKR
jgi:hypothetical protein